MISKLLSILSFYFFRIIFNSKKKKKIIILHSINDQTYSDNSKYLFEYLNSKILNCYWVTNNNEIIEYLKKKNIIL